MYIFIVAGDTNLYDKLYTNYYDKLSAIISEQSVRENELNIITGKYDNDILISQGIQTILNKERMAIQNQLNFEKYLGSDLWLEFCAYKRESKYSNSNYISDGLNNAELFEKALEFIDKAQKELYSSAELQHSISASLINLLVIPKFKILIQYLKTGNWLRILVDDNIYKLRLISYEIDYSNLNDISVEFSDVMKTADGYSDQQSLIQAMSSMATSYGYTQHQAEQGSKSNKTIANWVSKGLDVTNNKIIKGSSNQTQTWDEHGMLFRQYDYESDDYEDCQLKIINSTLAVTDDNWLHVKTAIGKYYYIDPETNQVQYSFGINAETVIGNLILGERLGIYNEAGSLKFDKNGFSVSNSTNTFVVNPNSSSIVTITNGSSQIFSLDSNGKLSISGKISADSGSIANWKINGDTLVSNDGTIKLDSKNNTLDIYENNDKLMAVNSGGIRFWRNGFEIGKIGITGSGDGNTYGLTFNLIDGDAMTWNTYDKENKVYINKLRYTETDGLKVYNNFRCNQFFGHNVVDIDLGDGKHAWGYIE